MKYMSVVAILLSCYLVSRDYFVTADEEVFFEYNGDKDYKSQETV